MATAKKVETIAADAQKTVTEQMDKVAKSFEDVAAFGKDNMDAVVKSTGAAVKVAEEMNAEVLAFSKKSVEESVAAAKELAGTKTVTEFVEKQSAFTKASFDGLVAQMTKFNEMMTSAAKDVSEPLSARVTAATEAAKSVSV